jgi:glycosyltransferase involved in cell wall biosynthesis
VLRRLGSAASVVLFLHNRYRTTGGEERVVADLQWLVREHLHESVSLLGRDSAELGGARAAAGLLLGGLRPEQVAQAVRQTDARVVHAHNVLPAFGWRALAAARQAGARVILHLHQYRLVCAIGVCFTQGAECMRCHGRHTLPGVRLNCRGSVSQSIVYGAALSLWQRRVAQLADAVIVPSAFARERLRALGAPLAWQRVHVLAPPLRSLALARAPAREGARTRQTGGQKGQPDRAPGGYALVVARLAPEKGVDVAIDACRLAGLPLVVAGEGPEAHALRARAGDGEVRFLGRVADAQLAELRARAAVALVPSRAGETFGLAAAEAMAAGVPVAASRVGALPELVADEGLVAPDDPAALAGAIAALAGDHAAAERGRRRVRERCAPAVVARALATIYDRPGERARAAADERA